MAGKLNTISSNICGSLICYVLHVTLRAPRTLGCLPDFWKLCVPLNEWNVCSATAAKISNRNTPLIPKQILKEWTSKDTSQIISWNKTPILHVHGSTEENGSHSGLVNNSYLHPNDQPSQGFSWSFSVLKGNGQNSTSTSIWPLTSKPIWIYPYLTMCTQNLKRHTF